MDMHEIIRKILQQFPVIYLGAMICTMIYCAIFDSDSVFTISYFAWMMLFSLLGAIPSLVFYTKKELSESKMRIRLVIHFVIIEVELLIMGYWLKLYHTFVQGCFFFLLICGVYAFVWVSVFYFDTKAASAMNQRIRERKKESKQQ